MLSDTVPAPSAIRAVALSAILASTPSVMIVTVAAIALEEAGRSGVEIGLFAAATTLGLAVFAPLAPGLYARIGFSRVHWIGMLGMPASALAFYLTDGFLLWCLVGFVYGAIQAIVWGTSETAIARFAPIETLGRTTGLFQTGMVGALALGPFLPFIFGLDTDAAFLVGVALGLVACLPLFFGPTGAFDAVAETGSRSPFAFLKLIRLAPLIFLFAFASGCYEFGISAVTSAEAADAGVAPDLAATVAGAILVGSLATQLLAGWLTDRMGVRRVALVMSGGLIMVSIGFALSSALWALWVAAFFWGAFGGALYTIGAVSLGHRFRGRDTGIALAGMIVAATTGGTVGPVLSGAALDIAGRPGLGLLVGTIAVCVFIASMLFGRRAC